MASYDLGKNEVVEYVKVHFPAGSSCLDVGACDGKWFDLLGDHLVMDAVEIFQPNIKEHRLLEKYNRCICMDIADYNFPYYDLIIFGDVIEHMTVDKAQRVLGYARNRCKDMIIGVPWLYPQGELYGNPYEKHLQADLTEELFNKRYPGYEILFSFENYAYFHLPNPPGHEFGK